ncbi:MAG TPA: thiamine-phosphate kinase [Phycisphaerae bacterium]|nr:thiamine-phosphate kinase [Phycisphaerae bacterium]
MEKSEDNLIAWISERTRSQPGTSDIPIGIGDDMAMIRTPVGEVLLTCDMLMDGVDFDTSKHTPEQIGRKALAVSLSDCAAMAVRPRWALVSVALPNTWTMEQAQRLYDGIESFAQRYEVAIIGGDTNSWNQPLAVDVTLVAEPWPGVKPVQRSGMKAHDLIIVTGELGGSLAGHHIDFEPRVREAKWLAEKLGSDLHAMIDLSDGLSTDAHRLAKASNRGIEFGEFSIELLASKAAIKTSKDDGRTVLDHVLNDGEDFELLFAVEPAAWIRLGESSEGQWLLDQKVTPRYRTIGIAEKEPGVRLKRSNATISVIEPRGWQHFK